VGRVRRPSCRFLKQ